MINWELTSSPWSGVSLDLTGTYLNTRSQHVVHFISVSVLITNLLLTSLSLLDKSVISLATDMNRFVNMAILGVEHTSTVSQY